MTTTWTDGYQTSVNYTYGYYRDLSPNYQKFCLLLSGVDIPETKQDTAHCELGFGQGISIALHASSSSAQYYGTDFNPDHATHASKFSQQAHVKSYFYDDSFEELLHRNDLPLFDSISLHGIFSWISHENQHYILKFIRKFLKPDGIVYISYNCLTGWAHNMPIRELLYSHFQHNDSNNQAIKKVQDALSFSENLFKQNPNFTKTNPQALNKIEALKAQNPNYLIHEYLNQDWQCFSFQQIVRLFEEVKMSFACSTELNRYIENINLSSEHSAFLNTIDNPIFKEQCRDYFANTQFRKDIFIRGKRLLSALEQQTRLRALPFLLLVDKDRLPKDIMGLLGQFKLLENIYQPIGDYFDKNQYQATTIAELERACPALNYAQILNALVILCHLGVAEPCQSPPTEEVLKQSQRINRHILQQSHFHQSYQFLISPITGIARFSTHFDQLFYHAHFVKGINTVDAYAEYVQNVLQNLGWFVVDEQKESITDRTESLKLIRQHAQKFLDNQSILIAKRLALFG